MNALNAMRSLTFVFIVAFSTMFTGPANAVTVRVVKGGTVGMNADLSNPGYFAGIVTLDIGGVKYQGMMDNFYNATSEEIGWQTDYTPWEGVLYTRNDILAGAYTRYSPAEYSTISTLFLDGMLGYANPPDPLWTASYNEMIWNILGGVPLWNYSNKEYPSAGSGVTMHDVFNSYITGGKLSSNTDYSPWMEILQTPFASEKELIVFKSVVPIPPAVWLFISGMLGLALISRKKQK